MRNIDILDIIKEEGLDLANVVLIQGYCASCEGSIDEEWAGKDPALGTRCRSCTFSEGHYSDGNME